ncbi:MAG: CHAT domain-containing protein [Anaerolineales bacterium]|nr:CHAT domain-containing protein [Anaerolineales bacterium]MCB9127436.1 CHAT domain-containing protein [Ardenticatenales bacterium]MCB9172231.1 CHAT domain-containing protein [Ardenticatenales bacterium]
MSEEAKSTHNRTESRPHRSHHYREMPPDQLAALVAALKTEADHHRLSDPQQMLVIGEQIVEVGREVNDLSYVGLGEMVRGDAFGQLGRAQDAWQTLGHAGNAFAAAHDEIGWARTRIVRLYLSMEVQAAAEALADAERAEAIFLRAKRHDRLVALMINKGVVHNYQGDYRAALVYLNQALQIAQRHGEATDGYIGMIHLNQGYAYRYLGMFEECETAFQRAGQRFEMRGEDRAALTAQHNIAELWGLRGDYRNALAALHKIKGQIADEWVNEQLGCLKDMVACYTALNHYKEAKERAAEIIQLCEAVHSDFFMAQGLLYLGIAEAKMGHLLAATEAFQRAESTFVSTHARSWQALTTLHRGQVAMLGGEYRRAMGLALQAHAILDEEQACTDASRALRVIAECQLALGELTAARRTALRLLQATERCYVIDLRYSAHLLLGRIAEQQGRIHHAKWRYRAAHATVRRMRSQLTFTLHPLFMLDKEEALQRLMRLMLQRNEGRLALETLEREKGQRWLDRVATPENWRWAKDDPQSKQLLKQLEQQRARYHVLQYDAERLATPEDGTRQRISIPSAELRHCEREIQRLTEQLFLQPQVARSLQTPEITVARLGNVLTPSSALIEYFDDGEQWWAMVLHRGEVTAHALAVKSETLDHLQRKLRQNIHRARLIDAQAPAARALVQQFRHYAKRLHQMLLAPLQLPADIERLFIVPFGALHTLPFHLLDSGQWLVEQYESVLLPAASLLLSPPVRRSEGLRLFSHSHAGRLRHAEREAERVAKLWRSQAFVEEEAVSDRLLNQAPTQLLHIAAHSEFYLDHPDLSAIHLHDGPIYAQQLMQQPMDYELITLSSCETGIAHIGASDDPLGLGHMLLYAGAGALVTSLWRVEDAQTARLMTTFYQRLRAGESKAAALRAAQRTMIEENPALHPAYWGAFTLIGNPSPLTRSRGQPRS